MERNGKQQSIKTKLWLLGLFGLLWEVLSRTYVLQGKKGILPPLSSVVVSTLRDLVEGTLFFQILSSLALIAITMVLALAVTTLMVYLASFHKKWEQILMALAAMLDPIPGVALLPLIFLWIGIGYKAVFAIVLHGVLWPIFINFLAGTKAVEPSVVEAASTEGAKRPALFFKILMPMSGHFLLAGLKIAWSRAFRSLIAAEMIAGAMSRMGGLGWRISMARNFMDVERLYGSILVLMLIGIGMETVLNHWIKVTDEE